MTLRVQVSQQTAVELNVEPINQWGDVRRIDTPSPVYDRAQPINVGHVVFFVEELAAVESFYREVLGFQVSDRYINRAVFLRCGVRGGHHNLFLLQLPNRKRGLNHVAFTVRDIHEVIGGGIAMNKNAWSTFIGPGRHPVSSAYFWYVNSPTGGAFEYYTNDDYLTENWQPRELEHSLVSFTEWAVEGGIDHDTRRQQKNRRRYDGADSHYRRRRAGGWAAKTLRDEGFSGEICVVAEEQWDFYERPPLSKAALLEAEPALPRLFSAEVQQALDLRWYRPLRAKSIDRQNKTTALSNGETLAYDLLLIATGGARGCRPRPGAASSGIYPAPLAGRAASEAAVGIGNAAGDRRRRLDWPRNRRLGAQKRRSRDPL